MPKALPVEDFVLDWAIPRIGAPTKIVGSKLVWFNDFGLYIELKRHESGSYSMTSSLFRVEYSVSVNRDDEEITEKLLDLAWGKCFTNINNNINAMAAKLEENEKLVKEYARNSKLPVL